MMRSALLMLLVSLGLWLPACGEKSAGKAAAKGEEKKEDKDEKDKKIKPISEVTKDAVKTEGLFPVYRDKKTGKAWLELNDKQFGSEFILFTYTENGLAELGHFRGNYHDERVIVFRKEYDKVSVISRNTAYWFDPASPLSRASAANVSDAILAVQKIAGQDEKAGRYLIDADALFLNDNLHQIKYSEPEKKDPKRFTLGKLSTEKTRFAAIKNYPANSDFLVEYVYEEKAPTGKTEEDVTDPRYVSLQLQYSMIAMPANDYKPRFDDERVGYFTTRVTDMTSTSATPYRDLIHRWHLKKKDPAAALSDPVEPITWWMENTTPRELRPTIRAAALQWNKAFEKAGFSNAMVVKEQPDDATWDAGDIRYNVLRWTSSPNPPFGGYGPSMANPRTGQILSSDIMLEWVFVTNKIKYARLWEDTTAAMDRMSGGAPMCCIADQLHTGALTGIHLLKLEGAPDVQKSKILKEGVYYLVLHELGHTLGLNHNMKATTWLDPKKINDEAFTSVNGLAGSVMDYPAANLAPLQSPQGQYYTTTPGPYDLWAIEFGYSDKVDDAPYRKTLLARSTEPGLAFGNDADDMRSPGRGIDPRVNIYDITSDVIGHSADRIRRIRASTNKALDRYTSDGGSYHELRDAFMMLTKDHATTAGVVARYLGGVYVERAAPGQTDAPRPLTPVPTDQQKRAMRVLTEQVFAPDALEAPEKLLAYARLTRRSFDFGEENEDIPLHALLMKIPNAAFDHIFHPKTLARLSDTALYGRPYPLADMLGDLTTAIFYADRTGDVSSIRRMVQAEYVQRLIQVVGTRERSTRYDSLTEAACWGELQKIRLYCNRTDTRWESTTLNHRKYLLWRIENALENNDAPGESPK